MTEKTSREARARYWHEQIQAWQDSGQTQQGFCKAHELNYSCFGYWLRKARQQSEGQRSGFVPVVANAPAPTRDLSLALPNGCELRGITADNLPLVQQLLAHLS